MIYAGCPQNRLFELLQQFQQFTVELVAVEVLVFDIFFARAAHF